MLKPASLGWGCQARQPRAGLQPQHRAQLSAPRRLAAVSVGAAPRSADALPRVDCRAVAPAPRQLRCLRPVEQPRQCDGSDLKRCQHPRRHRYFAFILAASLPSLVNRVACPTTKSPS